MAQKKKNPEIKPDFISLKEAAEYCDYTQEYLSLRARQGKLKAVKFARNWLTKKEWIEEYIREMEEYERNQRNQRKQIEVKPKLEEKALFVKGISISLSRISFFPKLKPALSLALILLLLFTSIALGKESFKNILQDTIFYVQQTPKTINHVLKESKKSLASSLDSLNQSFINLAEVIKTTDYQDLKTPIPLFKEYFQWSVTNLKSIFVQKPKALAKDILDYGNRIFLKIVQGLNYQVLTFRKGGGRFVKQIKEGILAFGQATKDLTLYIYNLALRTPDLLVRRVTESIPTLVKKIVDFGSYTSDKFKKGWQFLVLEFQTQTKELKEFVIRLFKPRITKEKPPEKEILVEVTREEFEKLKQEIEKLKEEGLPVREITKEIEVSRITKIEPIKEITKEIKILDDESLIKIRTALFEQETDVEKLKLAATLGYVRFPPILSLSGDTSIITLGTITTGTWNGDVITTTYGGSGADLSLGAQGGVLYMGASSIMGISAAGTSGYALISGGTGVPTWTNTPSWSTIALSTSATSPLLTNAGLLTLQTTATAGVDDIVFQTAATEKMRILENGDLFFEKGASDVTLSVTAPAAPRTYTIPDFGADVSFVGSNRQIATTSPLAGGGDLSANRTLTLAGLSSLGTGNYVVGVDAGATGWEYKNVVGTASEVDIAHLAGQIQIGLIDPLITSKGGTGLSSYTAGDILYYSSGTVLSKLGIDTANKVLTSSGNAPQWSTNIAVGALPTGGNWDITSDLTIETPTLFIGNDGGSYAGRVGIGTTTPQDKLDIRGDLLIPAQDTIVDCDGADANDPRTAGTCTTISDGTVLDQVASSDNLCADSLTSPTCVWVSGGAGTDTILCTADDTSANIIIGAVATPCAPAYDNLLDSSWAYYEDVTSNDTYDLGEDLYIDKAPATKYVSSGTGNAYFGGDIKTTGNLALGGATIDSTKLINSQIIDPSSYSYADYRNLNLSNDGGIYGTFNNITQDADTTFYALYNDSTLSSDHTDFYGVYNDIDGSGYNAGVTGGLYNDIVLTGTSSYAYGIYNYVSTGQASYGIMNDARVFGADKSSYDVYNYVYTTSDTATQTAYGVYNLLRTYSGASDVAYGVYTVDHLTGGSTGGTQYGLYVDLDDPEVTNYSIYVEPGSGISYFGSDVGIGTTSPLERLEVTGGTRTGQAPATYTTLSAAMDATQTTATVVSTSGYPSAGTLLIGLEAITYTGTTATTFTGLTRGALGTTAATHSSGATVKNYLFTALATATTPKMVITGDGNVGIGTAGPTTKLEVVGTDYPVTRIVRSVSATNTAYTPFSIKTKTSSDMVDNFGVDFDFLIEDNAGVENPIALIRARRSGADNSGKLIFVTYNAGTQSEKVTILPGGNVGIGDTSPDYLLELYDATNTPTFALSDDDIAHGLTTLAETDVFAHLTSLSTTAGGAQLTVISDTNAQALSVRGVIGSTDPTDTTPAIKLIGAKSDGTTGMADLGADETVFQIANNDNTAALTILGDGAVGIGTTSPSEKLTVAGGNIKVEGEEVLSEGFEGETFPPTSWTTGGDVNWARDTVTKYAGVASAASGTILDDQSSWLDRDYTFSEDGFISFYWKVSSEGGYDFLVFCLDNDSCTRSSGYTSRISEEVDWTEVSVPVSAGAHSFRWLYGKDSSASTGSDKGWVDNVTFKTAGNLYVLGNVGIGTTGPNEQLEITGNLRLSTTTATTGIIKVGADRFIHNYGNFNTFVGVNAGNLSMTGNYNTAMGPSALYSNTTGSENTAVGRSALYYNTTGSDNTAMGYFALWRNTTGNNNIAMGRSALSNNTTGNYNTAMGRDALVYNTTGNYNMAMGYKTLYSNTTGRNNIAVGGLALYKTRPTSKAITAFADYSATVAGTVKATSVAHGLTGTVANTGIYGTTNYNGVYTITVIDVDNFYFTDTWVSDDATGWWGIDTEGRYNTALGYAAGYNNITGSGNLFLGYQAGYSETGSDKLYIANSSGTPLIYGDFSTGNVGIGTTAPNVSSYTGKVLTIGAGATGLTSAVEIYGQRSGSDGSIGADLLFLNASATGSDKRVAIIRGQRLGDDNSGGLVFYSRNAGSFVSTVTIQSDGKVGIGRNPTTNKLEVEGSASKTAAGDWLANSDIRIKTDIEDLDNALEVINKLHPVKFRYTDEYRAEHESIEDRYYYNFIAQEFQQVFPDSVKEDGEGYLQLDAYNVRPYLVAAVQELSKEIEKLKLVLNDNGLLTTDGPLVLNNEQETTSNEQSLLDAFVEKVKQALANLGIFIEDGIVKIKELVVEKLKIGSREQPSGITLYDEETGEPYCVKMRGGELISLPGECDNISINPQSPQAGEGAGAGDNVSESQPETNENPPEEESNLEELPEEPVAEELVEEPVVEEPISEPQPEPQPEAEPELESNLSGEPASVETSGGESVGEVSTESDGVESNGDTEL